MTRLIDNVYPLRDVDVDTPYGKVNVDLTTTSGQWIAGFQGSREGEIIRRYASGVCYDIGANLGIYSVLMASSADVYAFEPNPDMVTHLLRTAASSLTPFSVIDVALSDRTGTADFFVPEDETMASFVDWTHDEDMAAMKKNAGVVHRVQCETTTLDEIVSRRNLPLPNFIKIDVEGAEIKVFRGGRKTIEASRPTIFFETSDILWRKMGTSHEEAFDFFFSMGYKLFRDQKELESLGGGWGDTLAIHSEIADATSQLSGALGV